MEGPPLDPRYPSLHEQKASVRRDKPLNLVIILQESLGAQYVGSLGGRDLTPNIDRLGKEGWMFHRAYATGTRSVRGIEAVTAGFLPSVADAVVKLPRSQTGFFTLAQVLGKHGYQSRFVYGGEAHFDNMRAFFLGNGFNEVVDRPKFVNPVFEGSWGASDEDMFNQVDRLLRADGDKPVFTLAFSATIRRGNTPPVASSRWAIPPAWTTRCATPTGRWGSSSTRRARRRTGTTPCSW